MKRLQITTLASNADADALETTRAELTGSDGRAVLPGGKVSFTVEPATAEALMTGSFVGFAYVPTTVTADGLATARGWRRWAGGDFDIIAGPGMVVGPRDVPPGADRVISLPLAVTTSDAASEVACGIFFEASFLG